MSEITNTRFPYSSEEAAIDQINAERARKRFLALFGIALALLALAGAAYMSYAS
jgi:hypothetical protein